LIRDLSRELDNAVAHVSELSDTDLQRCSDLIERALVHFLVEQNMRSGVSASVLTT
jgi:hypothetical protein